MMSIKCCFFGALTRNVNNSSKPQQQQQQQKGNISVNFGTYFDLINNNFYTPLNLTITVSKCILCT